jgi:hypothetical protein
MARQGTYLQGDCAIRKDECETAPQLVVKRYGVGGDRFNADPDAGSHHLPGVDVLEGNPVKRMTGFKETSEESQEISHPGNCRVYKERIGIVHHDMKEHGDDIARDTLELVKEIA